MHKKGENTPEGFCTRRVKPGQELLADLAGNVVRSLELCRSYEISLLCYILSSPRAKSARAVTGRRCPHSGRGKTF